MEDLRVIAHCYDCDEPHDVSDTDASDFGMKCRKCGGVVITPNGHMRYRLVERRYGEEPL